MTFPKSSVLLIFCLVHICAYAQENASELDNALDINEIEKTQAADDGTVADAAEDLLDIQPENAGEATDQLEAMPESEADQLVLEPEEEQSAAQEEVAEEPITLDLFESRSTYRNYMEAKQYPQAVDIAVHALKLSEAEFGMDDVELVPVLNELGLALLFTQQPEIAVQHFERSIALLEDNKGIFSFDLVDPLTGMGLANQQMENHAGAIKHFLRSQHVIHRGRGVTDLGQTNIMNMLTQSLLETQSRCR